MKMSTTRRDLPKFKLVEKSTVVPGSPLSSNAIVYEIDKNKDTNRDSIKFTPVKGGVSQDVSFDAFNMTFGLSGDIPTKNEIINKINQDPAFSTQVAYLVNLIHEDQSSRKNQLTSFFEILANRFNAKVFNVQFNSTIGITIRDFILTGRYQAIAVNNRTLQEEDFAYEDNDRELSGKEVISNATKNPVAVEGALKKLFPNCNETVVNYILGYTNQGGFIQASHSNFSLSILPLIIQNWKSRYNFIISDDGKSVTVIESVEIKRCMHSDNFKVIGECGNAESTYSEAGDDSSSVTNPSLHMIENDEQPTDEESAIAISQTVSVISVDDNDQIQHQLVSDKVIVLDAEFSAELKSKNRKMPEANMIDGEVEERLGEYADVKKELKAERDFYIKNKFNPTDYNTQVQLLKKNEKNKNTIVNGEAISSNMAFLKDHGVNETSLALDLAAANMAIYTGGAPTSLYTLNRRASKHIEAANYFSRKAHTSLKADLADAQRATGSGLLILGIGLIALGSVIVALSFGFGIVPGATLIAAGGVSLVSGVGLFSRGHHNNKINPAIKAHKEIVSESRNLNAKLGGQFKARRLHSSSDE